jgi:DNA-binding beta-propeller fold protein YncE
VKKVTEVCAQVLAHQGKTFYRPYHFEPERLFVIKTAMPRRCYHRAAVCWQTLTFAQGGSKQVSDPLTFVRQFSSAQDVRRTHPVVDKTLDIVAGPKEETTKEEVLHSPAAVAADPMHRVFVLDSGSRAVHVFDFGRGKYELMSGGERLQSPAGIATDAAGNVYVTDRNSRSVLIFDAKGKFSRELLRSRNEAYFEGPRGIAVHRPSGRLYVCDAPREMVIILDKRGKVIGRIGTRGGGRGPGEFRNPVKVSVAADEVVVLDAGNSRLQVFDLQGHFRRETLAVDVDAHSGLAADASGNIYVTDSSIGQIEVFGTDGRPLYRFGQVGEQPGQLNRPEGLWIESGCLYVADTGNRRVQEFRINGQGGSTCQ